MDNATMAEQLRVWAITLERVGCSDETAARGMIAGMRSVADDLEPLARVTRRVRIVRTWFEDKDYVEAHRRDYGISTAAAFWKQVCAEYNGACPNNDGSSVLPKLPDDVRVVFHEDGNESWRFTAVLDFAFKPSDTYPEAVCDMDHIQHIFFDNGGCAGSITFAKED